VACPRVNFTFTFTSIDVISTFFTYNKPVIGHLNFGRLFFWTISRALNCLMMINGKTRGSEQVLVGFKFMLKNLSLAMKRNHEKDDYRANI
jgi:hypothetical protein